MRVLVAACVAASLALWAALASADELTGVIKMRDRNERGYQVEMTASLHPAGVYSIGPAFPNATLDFEFVENIDAILYECDRPDADSDADDQLSDEAACEELTADLDTDDLQLTSMKAEKAWYVIDINTAGVATLTIKGSWSLGGGGAVQGVGTLAQMNAITANAGDLWLRNDAPDSSVDCSTSPGVGANDVLCMYTGSSWEQAGVAGGTDGRGYDTIEDEGTARTARSILNFIGSAVSCVDDAVNGETDCTFTAGTGDITDVFSCTTGSCQSMTLGVGDLITGTAGSWVNLAGGFFSLPISVSPTTTVAGMTAIDQNITDWKPSLVFYDGAATRYGLSILSSEISSAPADGHCITYNATTDELEFASCAAGGSDPGADTVVTGDIVDGTILPADIADGSHGAFAYSGGTASITRLIEGTTTDNSIITVDGTSGAVQESVCTISDSGAVECPAAASTGGTLCMKESQADGGESICFKVPDSWTTGALTMALEDDSTPLDPYVTADVSLVGNNTAALGTSEIAANSCATVVTVSATGVATTDVIMWTPNADIEGVDGYGVAGADTDGLVIYSYPTANNVNFKVCNATSSAITPGAVTLNWRVVR